MATPINLHRMRLLKLARSLAVRDPRAASGLCLARSLEFAHVAASKGHTGLQLVRWRVQGDPQFLDHWAVWLDEDFVIDLTRAQVDGQTHIAGPAHAYPSNYTHSRHYPAELLLPDLPWKAAGSLGPLSRPHLTRMAARLLHHDCARAWALRSPRWAAESLLTFGSFHAWLAVRDATRMLRARAAELTQILASQPSFAPGSPWRSRLRTPSAAAIQASEQNPAMGTGTDRQKRR
jgi:hypothetical protein